MVRLLKLKFIAGLPFIRVTVREDGNQEKDQSLALAREFPSARCVILGGLRNAVKDISPAKWLKSLGFTKLSG
jgi:hypothetical protein